MRVIVIGGGIGGLTAAIALNKAGMDVEVYERAPVLREVGAGIALAANALRALDVLGLGSAIRAEGIPGVQAALEIRMAKSPFVSIPPGELVGTVVVMHRAELLATLAQQIDPARLHLDRECIGFEQGHDGVTARFQNGETAHADVLVGADGLRSVVRSQMFGSQPALYAGYTAWRTVVEFDRAQDLVVGETWGRGSRFGIIPMSRGRVYWFAATNAAEGERDPEGQTRDVLARRFRGWHKPIEALVAAATEGSILRNDIYDMDSLPGWSQERVVLLGDAAHPMTPNLGQGGCQAIEDAVVLAACLKKNRGVDEARGEYQLRRIPRTREIVLRSRRLGVVAQLENPVLCWMRNAAMRCTPKQMTARQMEAVLAYEILSPSERELFRLG